MVARRLPGMPSHKFIALRRLIIPCNPERSTSRNGLPSKVGHMLRGAVFRRYRVASPTRSVLIHPVRRMDECVFDFRRLALRKQTVFRSGGVLIEAG